MLVQSGIATALPSTRLLASTLCFDDHLRKGALFNDGKPITSADVEFSIMAIKANHPFATMLARFATTPAARGRLGRRQQDRPRRRRRPASRA